MSRSTEPPLYRMPTGFGPSLGPRQGPDGRRFNGETVRSTVFTVPFLTDRELLAALLPAGLTPGPEPVVSIRLLFNQGFPWLAGRSYNYLEVLFRATFADEARSIPGDFVAVMWEDSPEAILVGREEAGHPKLFADVADLTIRDGSGRAHASWDGFRFFDCRFPDLALGEWPFDRESYTPHASTAAGVSRLPRFNHKYVPSSTRPGSASVDELLMIPSGVYRQKVMETWTGEAVWRFVPGSWEDLPIYANVVEKLAELPVLERLPASMVRVARETNDLRDELTLLASGR